MKTKRLVQTVEIIDAISEAVRRYVDLKQIPCVMEITPSIRPYCDLGMDSMHDLNIACEVEVILGVELPAERKLLSDGAQALSIEQAAKLVSDYLAVHPEAIND